MDYEIICKIVFWLSAFIVVFAMVGYPVLLILLEKIKKPLPIKKDYELLPSVTLMIVAHNEEKVIAAKLENAMLCDYPSELLEILVASDNSDDNTNKIVEDYISRFPDKRIILYKAKERLGKTNAQNEAQKIVNSDILVMTDANSIFEPNAVRELAACFTDDKIAYVCGRLVYKKQTAVSSQAESTYWNIDLKMRDIESRISTITAGNGAVYACRNSDYINFKPIECHDSSMPLYYGTHGRKALFNPDAVAYEKAGETMRDEFKRKIRMSRGMFWATFPNIRALNFFKCGWFSLFYFGHRTCRYQLWLAHLLLFISSAYLAYLGSKFFTMMFLIQVGFFTLAIVYVLPGVRMVAYYSMTILAQIIGVFNSLTGRSKPTWEKAESTR